jgi:riboflavin kinase/FMN adenylyltransferase
MHRDQFESGLNRQAVLGSSAHAEIAGADVAVVSSFDGFHASHRRLLTSAAWFARLQRAALRAVVLHESGRPALMPVAERCTRLLGAGAARVDVLELSDRSPDGSAAAIEKIKERTSCASVIVACAAPSDVWMAPLAAMLRRTGVLVTEVDRDVTPRRELVTSELVAGLVERGDVRGAAELLGRPYALEGEVVHGARLGRTIGFPTANLEADAARVLPARGVYAAVTRVGTDEFRSAVNIGFRPTVTSQADLLIEAHLLDFDGDLYGKQLRIELVERIRDESRFSSLDELREQLSRDVQSARTLVDESEYAFPE